MQKLVAVYRTMWVHVGGPKL